MFAIQHSAGAHGVARRPGRARSGWEPRGGPTAEGDRRCHDYYYYDYCYYYYYCHCCYYYYHCCYHRLYCSCQRGAWMTEYGEACRLAELCWGLVQGPQVKPRSAEVD